MSNGVLVCKEDLALASLGQRTHFQAVRGINGYELIIRDRVGTKIAHIVRIAL